MDTYDNKENLSMELDNDHYYCDDLPVRNADYVIKYVAFIATDSRESHDNDDVNNGNANYTPDTANCFTLVLSINNRST